MNSFPFCLGKAPATSDGRDLMFERYRTAPLPKHPAKFGHEGLVKSWGMLGNDRVGDCVLAGGGHETMLFNAEGGRTVNFTDKNAIADYSALTGYNPKDPSTDRGTNVRDAMKYRQKTGLIDAVNVRHLIAAYVAIEPGNPERILEALWLFGAVGIGIQVPSSCMDQFDKGKPWSVVRGSPIEGGHYVPLVAKRDMLYCVTWGRLQAITDAFIAKYCDEIWVPISKEQLVNGKSPEGFEYDALYQDSLALGA